MSTLIKKAPFFYEGTVRHYEGDTIFEGLECRYPIRSIKSCHYDVEISSVSSCPSLSAHLTGVMVVEDTSDAVIFELPFEIAEEALIMDKEDDEGEGYICPGDSFILEEILLLIIESSLPLKVRRN